jgi:hypothetical protein
MPEVLIEVDPAHLDRDDLDALASELEALGQEAKLTKQTFVGKAAEWVLVLHWVGQHAADHVIDGVLVAIGMWAKRWFAARRKPPPRRIDLLGPDGSLIRSVDVTD